MVQQFYLDKVEKCQNKKLTPPFIHDTTFLKNSLQYIYIYNIHSAKVYETVE